MVIRAFIAIVKTIIEGCLHEGEERGRREGERTGDEGEREERGGRRERGEGRREGKRRELEEGRRGDTGKVERRRGEKGNH